MANINDHFFFFLLLITFFLQIHARESQFFSKFTKETQLMPTTTHQQQEQQPDFIPQTKDSAGYGLYAHHLPPSTTTNGGGPTDNLPVSTFPADAYNTVTFETTDSTRKNYDGEDIDSSTMYNNQKQDRFYRHLPTATNGGGADVILPENYDPVAYTTPIHGKDSYQYNMYNSEKQGSRDSRVLDNGKYYHGGNMYNSEKQGMSDTRFMEDGKYYYDLNSERFDANMDSNPRGNGYNTRGYYRNTDYSYNHRYNSNARFQDNQEYVFNP